MSNYDNNFTDDRFQNLLASYRPRVWKQETALDMSTYSKPEPTSKTHIRSKNPFATKVIDATRPVF